MNEINMIQSFIISLPQKGDFEEKLGVLSIYSNLYITKKHNLNALSTTAETSSRHHISYRDKHTGGPAGLL
jgi:hypothetical protein